MKFKPDFANLKRYETENLKLKSKDFDTNRIVFIGDSIIEFWNNKNGFFKNNSSFVNRGISSQTASQILLRFENDVIELQPKKVIVLCGINDIAENNGKISIDEIFENFTKMIQLAIDNWIEVVVCSLLPCNFFYWNLEINLAEKVVELYQLLKKYSLEKGIDFVDFYSEMVGVNFGICDAFSDDRIHPNENGYLIMEQLLFRYL